MYRKDAMPCLQHCHVKPTCDGGGRCAVDDVVGISGRAHERKTTELLGEILILVLRQDCLTGI